MKQRQDLPAVQGHINAAAFIPERAFQPEPDEIDLRGFLAIFHRRKRLMIAIAATVFIVGMLYTLSRRPEYESVAKILVFTQKPALTSSDSDLPILNNLDAIMGSRSIDTQVEVISSPDLLDSAFMKLNPSIREEGFREDTIPDWACKISQVKDADVVAITSRAYTPEAAAALARAIAAEYFARDLKQSNQAVHQARIFAEGKMAAAERDLSAANGALSQYKREVGLFAPETQLTRQAENMADLLAAIDSTRAEISSRRQENNALLRGISAQQKDVLTNTTVTMNPQFTAELERIDKLQSDRTALLQEYKPDSREVRDIEERINLEETRLKRIAATVVGSRISARNPIRDALLTQYSSGVAGLAAASARLRSLQAEAGAHERMASQLPERERELAERMQKVSMLQRTYEMLSTRYHTLLLSEQSALPSGMLTSTPRIAESPTYPKTASNAALFLVLGVLLALAMTLVAERLDLRVHDAGLAEQMSGASALSVIPDMTRESPRLSSGHGEKPILLESFRILRNNISFTGLDHGLKVLAITSPGRAEGKSTTTVNLGVTMAMDGNRVLLVDGDMRHPSLHKFLGIPGQVGLSTLLRQRSNIKAVIRETSTQNLHCIPAGPAQMNSTELLRSEAGINLFKDLRERYDAILIDCPPATGISDVQAISTLADGILLVVSISRTLKSHLDTAIRMLSYTGIPLVGLVMNRVDVNLKNYGYYYGSYAEEEPEVEEAA